MWEEMMQGEKICYVKPRRAIRRLKAADEENITAYIYGVSGCGKTELVMRYLKNRKYTLFNAGLVTVEELREIKVSKQRKTVVINSLHDMAMQNDTEEIREAIIELVEREDVWLILSGRCAVPPWLTAVRYREVFYVIGEQELLFDEDQADQYIAMTGMIFSEEQRAKEKAYCVGMPIGWSITNSVYWQMRMGQDEKDVTKPFSDEEYRTMVGEALSQMWDYLEYHVYDRWEISIQEFLMEVAIVEDFTVYMAEMITGRNDVESLLERIQWIGNFMDIVRNGSETVYKLRNQMRISMIRRLRRKYTKEQIRKLYENAGLYYQISKQPLKALSMYQQVNDTERIASVLIDNVRIAPNNAYYYELKPYYLKLPEEKICKSPELMCGMSMLQSLLLNTEESERWYRELQKYAKEHTGSERRSAKGKILYLDIGLPHRGSDHMVEILKNAYLLLLDKEVKMQEFSVTSNQASQMNGGKDFCEWSKRDRELAGSIGKIEQCFVGDGMLAWLHIITGKVKEAEELLTRFKGKAQQENAERILPNIDTFLVRCALYDADKAAIAKWLAQAPDEELIFSIYDRFHYITKVRVYLQNGRNEQAYHLLLKCAYYAKVMQRTYIDIEVKLLLAITQYRMGEKKWDETLGEALTKAEEYHFVRIITREGAAIRPLLQATSWRPSEVEKDPAQTRKNKQFWAKVQDETEKMARFYPAYLKVGVEEVTLSDTMLRILKLQADGMSKEKIAAELNMTTANVKYHTQQIYKRLGVSNKAGAVMEAGKRGLI